MNKRIRHKENNRHTGDSSSFFKKKKDVAELEILAYNFEPLAGLWINLFQTFALQYAEHGRTGTKIIYSKLKPISDQILDRFESFDNQYPDAVLLIKKCLNEQSLPKGLSSSIKKIEPICHSINIFDLNQFISDNMTIFKPDFLQKIFEYISQFYKNNTDILFEFNRIQKAAKDFLSSFNCNQHSDNKQTILTSLIRLRTDFLNFKTRLVIQLETQETELKSKTNQLKTLKKDEYPLLTYIHDELCERLNFLTETLNIIRQYDQELKKLILNLDPNVKFNEPTESKHSNYSLTNLFSY